MSPTSLSDLPVRHREHPAVSLVGGATVAAAGLAQAALILAGPALGPGLVAVRSLRGGRR